MRLGRSLTLVRRYVRAKLASTGAPITSTASTRGFAPGERVLLAVRSEKIESAPGRAGENVIPARIKSHVYVGSAYEYLLETAEGEIRAATPDPLDGPEVQLYLPPDAIVALPADNGEIGGRMQITIV